MQNDSFIKEYLEALQRVKDLTEKTNKRSVLIVQQDVSERSRYGGVTSIRESISNIICIISVIGTDYADKVISASNGIMDFVLIDSDTIRHNSKEIKDSYTLAVKSQSIPYAFYSDVDNWATSSINFIKCIENNEIQDKRILILGNTPLAVRMIIYMVNQGISVNVLQLDYPTLDSPLNSETKLTIDSPHVTILGKQDVVGSHFDLIIGCAHKENYQHLEALSDCDFSRAYDIGIKNFPKEFIAEHSSADFFRSDDRAGIASLVINIMESEYLVSHNLGRVKIGGLNVVSGGVVGHEGDVVVDNAFNPTTVLGIANGDGTFKHELSQLEIDNINKISALI